MTTGSAAGDAPVPSVVVTIPTFRRREQLDALLPAVAAQAARLSAGSRVRVRIVAIDNDPAGSAEEVARRNGVGYVAEPARGLAHVRNRALDEGAGDDALVFIDDDEVPHDDWLATLVGRWLDDRPAAVSGRVVSRFPDDMADPWIRAGGFFERVAFADGARQPVAATNNLLLDLGVVRAAGLRFDERFGLSGGEDILFSKQLVRAGGVLLSCPAAVVVDPVTRERFTRSWVLRRAYRVGLSTARVDLALVSGLLPSLAVRARFAARGLGRVVIGGGRWMLGAVIRSPRHAARGARAFARGGGMLGGAAGLDYAEYARR